MSKDSDAVSFQNKALLLARILLVPLFYYSGILKVTNFAATATKLPGGDGMLGAVLLSGAVAVELGIVTLFLIGLWPRLTAVVMILYVIAATLMFHQFWAASEAAVVPQTLNFLKNLGIIGGFALIAAFGPGAYSVQAMARGRD
jgi:putative oxidoreductase